MSPVAEWLSFAIAPMSPATISLIGSCVLPRIVKTCPTRSSTFLVELCSAAVALDGPGVDAEETHAANVRVGGRLEDQSRLRRVRLGLARRSVDPFDRGPVERRRAGGHDDVGETVDPDQMRSRADDHGEHASLVDAFVDRLDHLVLRDLAAFEVPLEQLVVRLRHAVEEVGVHLLEPRLSLLGDVDLGRLAVRVLVCLFVDDGDDALEVVLASEGQFDRGDRFPECVSKLLQDPTERRVLAVEFVDEDHARELELVGVVPCRLCLNLDALDARDDEYGEVRHPHRSAHVADEVGVPGSVEDVDLGTAPLDRRKGGGDRDAFPDLLLVEVTDGVALRDLPHACGGSGEEDEGLRQRRLARTAVPYQDDVPDVLGRVALQPGPPSIALLKTCIVFRRRQALRPPWAAHRLGHLGCARDQRKVA